ncbi:hypothetical protein H4S14_003367 [Agrobacterium vitis]|nr:hypothetical protein [Agrobacterium vitis]MBE1439602.1 hypothetical protein [Agrobacterium vitis]
MSGIFAKAVLIGLTAMGAVTAAIGPAAAQPDVSFSLFVGADHDSVDDDDDDVVNAPPAVVKVWGDDYGRYGAPPPPPPYWDRPNRWDGPPPRWDGPPPRWGGPPPPRFSGVCSPGDAMRQARRDGLRQPYIERVTPRSVIVGGRRYGGYDRIILINRPGCPYAV